MRSPRLLYRKPHSSVKEPSGAALGIEACAWVGWFVICCPEPVWACATPATLSAASARTDNAFIWKSPLLSQPPVITEVAIRLMLAVMTMLPEVRCNLCNAANHSISTRRPGNRFAALSGP